MDIDLSKIAMEKGQQYETIITTIDKEGNFNASPFGVICRGKDKVMCRIFKGSRTLENIMTQKEFRVNISDDSELFTSALLKEFNEKDFKDIDCYFKCEVNDLKEAIKQKDILSKKSETVVIKAHVTELVINKPIKAYNRSFGYVIENLVNLSRFDIADDEKKEYYLKRFEESNRVIKKVGSKKDRESMDKIKNKLNEKGYVI